MDYQHETVSAGAQEADLPLEAQQATVGAQPFVSVIVPCRNEERYIGRCLDSILAGDYPSDRLEVLVLDGMSEDKTRSIVEGFSTRYRFIRVVENPKRTIPAAMNTGIREARGEVLIKLDAHSIFAPNHISACVRYQRQYGAENVGGGCKILPGADTPIAKAIVQTLASPFGSGNAHVKVCPKVPTWTDAVAFGCYRKNLFDRIGLFDERLQGSSDMDMNHRIQVAGGRVLLVPDIIVEYFADPDLGGFWRHNFADGVWATYVLKFGRKAWRWRHWVPLGFVSALFASGITAFFYSQFIWVVASIAGSYFVASLATSARISWRERNAKYLLTLPPVFAVRHFAHGLGALFGLALLLLPGVHWKGRRKARS